MSMIAELAVKRTALMHPKQCTATLNLLDGTTTQAYASVYIYPITVTSGLGNQAMAVQNATICLHQQTETIAPMADNWITITSGPWSGTIWNVGHVETNSDYTTSTALHVCTCSRKA